MKLKAVLVLTIILSLNAFAQNKYEYEPTKVSPFGKPNPEAPVQIKDYAELIGICDCKSVTRKQDQTWADPVDTIWEFRYIMNGTAVQDETLKADGTHSGSIRQFDKASGKWNVHFYSITGAPKTLQSWQGGRKEDQIILYKDQKAPNGSEGFYKIVFSNINKTGFNWEGAWVNTEETIHYALWKIDCIKRI